MYFHCLLFHRLAPAVFFFFFFNDTATTEIYTLSLHDALPILVPRLHRPVSSVRGRDGASLPGCKFPRGEQDRKSTRLNSSHGYISYAVFCLKKKKPQLQYLYTIGLP